MKTDIENAFSKVREGFAPFIEILDEMQTAWQDYADGDTSDPYRTEAVLLEFNRLTGKMDYAMGKIPNYGQAAYFPAGVIEGLQQLQHYGVYGVNSCKNQQRAIEQAAIDKENARLAKIQAEKDRIAAEKAAAERYATETEELRRRLGLTGAVSSR